MGELSTAEAGLGLTFRDKTLLQRALTHRSYINENEDFSLEDNERLEFLGDAVLDFITAEYLYHRFPEMSEGQLTSLRAALVRTETLASFASLINLGRYIFLGRGEEENGGRVRPAILCDCYEALVGALYLDQGLEASKAFVVRVFKPAITQILEGESDKDAKSLLQELSQKYRRITPTYRTVGERGPDHAKEFTVAAVLARETYGVGVGHSKQVAAQVAAKAALTRLEQEVLQEAVPDEACPRLLVIGGSGELGSQVVIAASGWDVHATYFTRPARASNATWHPLDITDRQAVHGLIRELRPQAVIHAAVSDRDRAKFPSDANYHAAIVDGSRYLAEAASQMGARCVVLSTDLVFDGTCGNYTEEDIPNPIMDYGQAKADMEAVLLAMDIDVVLVRTSLLLTLEPMGRHVAWIVDALRRGEGRDLFTDELRCPIWSDELAVALLELATLDYRGLLHVAGPEIVHRYALGLGLANYFALDPSFITPALSSESGLNRPLDCTLNCRRAYALLRTPIHDMCDRLGRSANTS